MLSGRSGRRASYWASGLLWLVTNPLSRAQSLPEPLRNKHGLFRAAAYVQLLYQGVDEAKDTFGVRRLKLMMGGDLNSRWQWYAQGIFQAGMPMRTDGHVYFQEGWLRWRARKTAQLVFGQFKPAMGRERFTSDFHQYTIDRSVAIRTLVPNGEFPESFARDYGIQLDGTLGERWRYAAGLFAGNGANRPWHGISPMLTARSTVDLASHWSWHGHPVHATLGGSFSVRRARDLPFGTRGCPVTQAALRHFSGTDRRIGIELAADWGAWSLASEYLQAAFLFRESNRPQIVASGYYIQLARFLTPKWQVAVKWETFDPNHSLKNDRDLRWFTLGVNYYIRADRIKVMANYIVRRERVDERPNDVFQVQFQWFFI